MPRTADPMEAEEALRFTQFLLDRAGEGAFWTDPDGRFFYVNEAACSMLGYTREEMLAIGVADILPPEKGNLFQELSREGPRRRVRSPSRWSTSARTASASLPR